MKITDRMLDAGKGSAGRVFGWQHLARYSGASAEWMDSVLGAVVRNAIEGAVSLIAAQALRDAAEAWSEASCRDDDWIAEQFLKDRADAIEDAPRRAGSVRPSRWHWYAAEIDWAEDGTMRSWTPKLCECPEPWCHAHPL